MFNYLQNKLITLLLLQFLKWLPVAICKKVLCCTPLAVRSMRYLI